MGNGYCFKSAAKRAYLTHRAPDGGPLSISLGRAISAFLFDQSRGRTVIGGSMRARHIIAVAVVILVGFGVKFTFFNAPAAEAVSTSIKNVSMDIDAIHANAPNIPAQNVYDMTFVLTDGN
jgi:hypothetical protein